MINTLIKILSFQVSTSNQGRQLAAAIFLLYDGYCSYGYATATATATATSYVGCLDC